ncbi:hypothetical protein [Methylomonas rapida]|uniref:Uncharacterized protein n=1 Tax=Methylomonas rapida TaxID=2963939 RepID=A0ABY7GH11_9GAMM|nr:hypothetical protein [Methylomonas rapida]WAR43526.1 hypothetical protein NM686_014205 [Methylomonas rapida]
MITLSKITREEAKETAMMFLSIWSMWADCFFDPKAGARLLGINEENYEGGDIHYDHLPTAVLKKNISQSNLENNTFVKRIEEILDFAQTGAWNGIDTIHGTKHFDAWLLEAITELGSFRQMFGKRPILSFKEAGIVMLGGDDDPILNTLLTITDAAYARWKLLEGLALTLDEIALLAGVGIKTVRNAVSSKGHDRLIVSGRIEDKTVIEAEEAYRWLLTKKGFTGPFLYHEEPPFDSYETLGQFRHHCYVMRTLAKLEIAELTKKLDWNESLIQAYTDLEKLDASERLELLTPETLMQIGKFYQSKNLHTFVVEGSRILAAVAAEYRAKQLFN